MAKSGHGLPESPAQKREGQLEPAPREATTKEGAAASLRSPPDSAVPTRTRGRSVAALAPMHPVINAERGGVATLATEPTNPSKLG